MTVAAVRLNMRDLLCFCSKCDGRFRPGSISGLLCTCSSLYLDCLTDKTDEGCFYYCMLGECMYCTHVMWPLIECFKSTDNNLFTQRTCNVVGLCPRFVNIVILPIIPLLLIWFGCKFGVHY